jgi:hypothetical protein
MPLETQHPTPSTARREEVCHELDLLLQSPPFKRAEKLQKFLRFVCDRTLDGRSAEINEHLIAIEVFQRGHEYNPAEDAIVRRHAHAMRQKLQEYYATEGIDRPLRIEMPVGRYVPTFRRREDIVVERPFPIALAPPPETQRSLFPRGILLLAAAIALFLSGWLAASFRPAPVSATMREIWGPWIGKGSVLSFSNATSAMVREYINPVPSDSVDHGVRLLPEQEPAFREKFGLAKSGGLYIQPTIAQTMIGEAIAATQLASLFNQLRTPLRIMENRFLSWENLRRENRILFGGDEDNRWIDFLLSGYPFRMTHPTDGALRSIINTDPQPGEAKSWQVVGTEEVREEYALISMVSSVVANQECLVICGLNSPAAPLATDYLTSEDGRLQLLKLLREKGASHSGRWHFQMVVKVDVRDKVPTMANIVALRVI